MDISDLSQRAHDTIATPPRRQNDVATSPQRQKTPSRITCPLGLGTYIQYAFNTRPSSSWPHTCIWSHQLLLFMNSRMHSVYFRRTAILDKQSPRQSYAVVTSSNHLAPTHTLTLTHLSLDKMSAISQTTFSNAFSWMKKKNIHTFN